MGRQLSSHPIKGTFGEFTFYHHKLYGALVRTKTGPTGKQVKTSPKFINTRRQNAEFGGVSATGALMRRGLRDILSKDATTNTRLFSALWSVLECDKSSAWGERSIARALSTAEGRARLEGFEFMTGQAFMKQLSVKLTDERLELKWAKKQKPSHKALCVAVTVGRLGFDPENMKVRLEKSGPAIFQSGRSTTPLVSRLPELKKPFAFELIVMRVQKVRKSGSEFLITEDGPCSVSVLKVHALGRPDLAGTPQAK